MIMLGGVRLPKLAKNYYRTAKGEKKLNCYLIHIPKEVVKKTDISEQDEVRVYEKNKKIIVERVGNNE